MGKTLRQLGVSTDSSHRVAEAWGVLGTSFIPVQVSDCRAAKGTRLQRHNPGPGFSEASEGNIGSPAGCLPQRMEKARGSWPHEPPNSKYPAHGILSEGLGVTVKSDHPWTGSGSRALRGHR